MEKLNGSSPLQGNMSKALFQPRPVPHSLFRLMLNLWPPYRAAGVRVDYISRDYRRVHVSMHLHWFNRNYVGTHFGGSLYAMTDPFFMLMLIQILGPGHIIWDKAATIRFLRPGKGRVCCLFQLETADITQIQETLASKGKTEWRQTVKVIDADLQVVAEVDKVVYIRQQKKHA